MNRAATGFAAACAALLCVPTASAQAPAGKPAGNWPARAIRIVIPYPPGGTSDILARLIGVKVTENFAQQVIVENRTGANGNIGAEVVARAQPDGYTFLLTDIGNLSIAPSVYKLAYDPIKDFAPVTVVSYSPHLLAVHPSLPVKTMRELINLAKANSGKLNYPTGLGGAPHFAGMQFAQRTGVNWTYIGTRGGADSALMVASGQAEVLFLGMLQTLPHVRNNRLKLIAVSSEKRVAALPDTPTVSEGPGLAGFVTGSWQGIMAPVRVSSDVIAKFNGELVRVLGLPDIKEKLTSQGTDPVANPPQEAAKWFGAEHARMAKLIKETGFKLE
jgi:tripartite-type tricarboxylate transporter receptor subunit TctC